jgi:ribonuclease D
MHYETVETPVHLEDALHRLRGHPLIAADTEAAGYHRYLDRISLIQLSTREENFLIDPLAIEDLSPLRPLFEDPEVETVFHDADYDLRIMDRDLGIRVRGLFDTQIAAAFLGDRQLGLGAVLEKYLELKLPKAYQRADWAERPLSDGMKDYAAQDTAHLPALRDRLRAALVEKGRLAWAEEEFLRREETRWVEDEDPERAFMRMKGARDVPPRGLAILRELFAWRESVASERDVATFRVVPNQTLLGLSVNPPRSTGSLREVSGLSDGLVHRRGREIIEAVNRGLGLPEEDLPRYPRGRRFERDPEVEERSERLKEVRNRRAETLDLDPGFLMSRAQLEEIARRNPDVVEALEEIPDVRRWQIEALGPDLLSALRR